MRGLRSLVSSPAVKSRLCLIRVLIFRRKALTLFFDGVMKNLERFPRRYLRIVCPKKSNPSSIRVMTVFVGESSSPRSRRQLLHQRFNLLFQQFFRTAGDTKIIGIPDQVNLGSLSR